MASGRFLTLYRLRLQRYRFPNISRLSTVVNAVRSCSSVLESVPKHELGNFAADLKPFLKTRKKQNPFFEDSVYKYRKEDPVIKCKFKDKNHYRNQEYPKFKPVPLASENWRSHKSVGDYFTVSIYTKDYQVPDNPKTKFEECDVRSEIVDILKEHNITFMSPVQEKAIPKISMGYNTLIGSETGCGKTLAYLVPVIEQVLKWKENKEDRFNSPFVIILTPSRELAEQIREVIQWFKPIGIKSHKLLGGHFTKKIFNPNVDDIDFLVSTVGAISKFIATGIYSLENVRHLILDEADALLDDSFNETTLTFLKRFKFIAGPSGSKTKGGTQLTLVSATMPTSMSELLGDVVELDLFETITTPNLHKTMPHVPQKFLRVNRSTRPAYLLQIAKAACKKKEPLIIFCNSSSTCDWVSVFLNDNNVENLNLNGDMHINFRKNRFKRFQDGEVNVLVCTSVASRGLDTTRVREVVNYEFPSFITDYIHRCGRTGRLSSEGPGKVINLISGKNEIMLVQKIETSVRLMTEFENVNPNIKRIIRFRGRNAFVETKLGIDDSVENETDIDEEKQ